MNTIKKLITAILSLTIILSLTSCGDISWAAKLGDEVVTSGMYLTYQLNAYSGMFQHEDYNGDIDDPMKQTIEGKSSKDYINSKAEEGVRNYLLVESKFKELNLALTDEETANFENQYQFEWGYYSNLYTQNDIGEDSFRKVSLNRAKQQKIFDSIYGKDGTNAVSDADLLVHFKENYTQINYIDLTTTNDSNEPLPAAEIETIKAKAQTYVDRINAGEPFNGPKVEFENENLAEGEEAEEKIPGDDETKQIIQKDDEYYHADLVKAAFEIKEFNKAILVEGKESIFVVVKYDVTKDESSFDEMRPYVLSNLKGDEFTNDMKEEASKLDVTMNSAAVSRYNPKKLSLEEAE